MHVRGQICALRLFGLADVLQWCLLLSTLLTHPIVFSPPPLTSPSSLLVPLSPSTPLFNVALIWPPRVLDSSDTLQY